MRKKSYLSYSCPVIEPLSQKYLVYYLILVPDHYQKYQKISFLWKALRSEKKLPVAPPGEESLLMSVTLVIF